MSKRFPVPEFDRDHYKNMEWKPPKLLTAEEHRSLLERARKGDAAVIGTYAVHADESFYDKFRIKGDHRHAILCITPPGRINLVGRSWAWYIQRALIVDSLDPAKATVLHDWTTPRPMNTRLGPENGVEVEGGVLYVIFGHRYSDYWISNRTLQDSRAKTAKGFSVVSNSDEANNDFHACNLSFSWA